MPLKFETTNPPIGLDDIAKLESDLNMKLPEQYKQFLLKYNGGQLMLNHRRIIYYDKDFKYNTYTNVRDFCGIVFRGEPHYPQSIRNTYDREYSDDPLDNGMLPECIPIAWDEDGGHTFYGISISPDLYGQVFMWMPEHPTYEDANFIADSFDEFIDLIDSRPKTEFDDDAKLIE